MTHEFENYDEAEAWMVTQFEDDNVDNERFAFDDDPEAVARYIEKQDAGCCGFFDEEIIVAGRPAMIGCNYGH